MAKRVKTEKEQLDAIDATWVRDSDTGIRCQQPACRFKQRATYWTWRKVMNGKNYDKQMCFECRKPSPFSAEHDFTTLKPSSLEKGTK